MQFAYFAKTRGGFWVVVSTNCTGDDTLFYDKHFTAENGYIATRIVTLD